MIIIIFNYLKLSGQSVKPVWTQLNMIVFFFYF